MFAFKVYDIDRDGFISNGELFQVSFSFFLFSSLHRLSSFLISNFYFNQFLAVCFPHWIAFRSWKWWQEIIWRIHNFSKLLTKPSGRPTRIRMEKFVLKRWISDFLISLSLPFSFFFLLLILEGIQTIQ